MNFFRATYAVLIRELRRIRCHKIYFLLMVALPLLSFAFFSLFFEEGVPHNMPIAVFDEDQTVLSRKLIDMIDATASAEVSYELPDMVEGERLMKSGKIDAIVQIPSNFEKDILSNTQTKVAAYISGMNISANGLLNKDLQTAVVTFSSGIQIQLLMKKGLSEKMAYAQMMPVHFDKHVLFNPYTNYGYYLLPSFLPMMLMIFTILATIYAIGTELKFSTAGAWFDTAGGRLSAALAGKLLPYTVTMFVLSLLMNTIMYKWVGVPLRGSAAMLIIAGFLFVLAYQSIGVMIVSIMSNLRLALSIGGGYSVLAFTFSGLTFPLMAMNRLSNVASCIFPFTFYTDIFVDQAMRGAPVIYSLNHLAVMCLFIFLPLLCLPRLKKIATHKEYWGRL